jgi:phosphoribosylformimino-5-aminoimidazole carboxamide ribotide isomerase
VERARGYSACGARWIHIVDLDAAEGKGIDNRAAIRLIRDSVGSRMQVGGGVRSLADASALVTMGIDRIVIGTAVVRAPEEVKRWISELGPRFIGGIDARDGVVKVSAWAEESDLSDIDVAARLAGLGFRGMVYTNIGRDGTLVGPDIDRTCMVARAADLPTILSGGVGSPADVERLADRRDPLIRGVILGKALYEGTVELEGLISRFDREPAPEW